MNVNDNGWIVLDADARKGNAGDQDVVRANSIIQLTPSCRQLLEETRLSLAKLAALSLSDATRREELVVVPLDELPHSPNLATCLLNVIADVRCMGGELAREHPHPHRRPGGRKQRHPRFTRLQQGGRQEVNMEEQQKARIDLDLDNEGQAGCG